MSDLGPFVDELDALEALLADFVPADHVVTWTGTDLQQLLVAGAVIKLASIGGDDNRVTARPRVDVVVLAARFDDAWSVAKLVRQRLLSYPHATAAGVIDRVVTEVSPHEVPYDDPDVRQVVATYRLATRRRG